MRPQRTLQFDHTAPAELLIEVTCRFEEAAMTLARLPGVLWRGSVPTELLDELDDELLTDPLRKPTPAEISRMDETFRWISLLPPMPDPRRVLVLRRLIRSARSGKHRYSWRRLGNLLEVSHHTAKAWHGDAMALIARNISQPQISTSHTSHSRLHELAS